MAVRTILLLALALTLATTSFAVPPATQTNRNDDGSDQVMLSSEDDEASRSGGIGAAHHSRRALLRRTRPRPPRPPRKSPPPPPPQTTPVNQSLPGSTCPDAAATLVLHNAYRAAHHAPPLVWDEALAAGASAYAHQEVFVAGCRATPSNQTGSSEAYGENQNLCTQSNVPLPLECASSVRFWYSQGARYDFSTPQPFTVNWPKNVGDFTQVVWKDTTRVGCGVSQTAFVARRLQCRIVVCRYLPQGNIADNQAFLDNVKPK